MAFLYNILGTYMCIYFLEIHPPFLKCKNWKSNKQIYGGKKFWKPIYSLSWLSFSLLKYPYEPT